MRDHALVLSPSRVGGALPLLSSFLSDALVKDLFDGVVLARPLGDLDDDDLLRSSCGLNRLVTLECASDSSTTRTDAHRVKDSSKTFSYFKSARLGSVRVCEDVEDLTKYVDARAEAFVLPSDASPMEAGDRVRSHPKRLKASDVRRGEQRSIASSQKGFVLTRDVDEALSATERPRVACYNDSYDLKDPRSFSFNTKAVCLLRFGCCDALELAYRVASQRFSFVETSFPYEAAVRGVALTFDVVGPNFDSEYTIDLYEAAREDASPLCADCECFACSTHSVAYLAHLNAVKEVSCRALLFVHNVYRTSLLFEKAKKESFKKNSTWLRDFFEAYS